MGIPTRRSLSRERVPIVREHIEGAISRGFVPQPAMAKKNKSPFIFRVEAAGSPLGEVIECNLLDIKAALLRWGAVLFRGFHVENGSQLREAANLLSTSEFMQQESAVTTQGQQKQPENGAVQHYPTAEVPENCHFDSFSWPRRTVLHARDTLRRGSKIKLWNLSGVHNALESDIRHKFLEKGLLHVTNYYPEPGYSWEERLGTCDRKEVEKYFQRSEIEFDWLSDGQLRSYARRPAIFKHPETTEAIWFNRLNLWPALKCAAIQGEWSRRFAPEEYPVNCFFGDGTDIPQSTMEAIISAYDSTVSEADWQAHDILVLDNVLVSCEGETLNSEYVEHWHDELTTLARVPADYGDMVSAKAEMGVCVAFANQAG